MLKTQWNPELESLGDFFANNALALAESRESGRAQLTVYRVDAIVNRRGWTPSCAGHVSERGKIGGAPSSRSLRNLVFVLNNSDIRMESMLTLTMTPLCHQKCSPAMHRKACKLALQRLRDQGIRDYVWVREFQKNGSVHWHIFTSETVGAPGDVNHELSHDWRMWWCSLYWDKIIGESKVPKIKKRHAISRARMERGNGKDFHGSCRFEQLKSEAAGRYAAKEGAKRFQKHAPGKWKNEGGAWWRASKSIVCTPIKEVYVPGSTLETVTIKIKNQPVEVAYKLQQNRGLKILSGEQADQPEHDG